MTGSTSCVSVGFACGKGIEVAVGLFFRLMTRTSLSPKLNLPNRFDCLRKATTTQQGVVAWQHLLYRMS
jgi:hypothetical protein